MVVDFERQVVEGEEADSDESNLGESKIPGETRWGRKLDAGRSES